MTSSVIVMLAHISNVYVTQLSIIYTATVTVHGQRYTVIWLIIHDSKAHQNYSEMHVLEHDFIIKKDLLTYCNTQILKQFVEHSFRFFS